jgi:soluble lytic murein transglycosylase
MLGPVPVVATTTPSLPPFRPIPPVERPDLGSMVVGSDTSASVVAATSTPIPVAPVASPAPVDSRFGTVDQLLTDGDLAQAETLLRELSSTSDQATAAHATFLLGRTLFRAQNAQLAAQTFETYLVRYPSGTDAAAVNLVLAERTTDTAGVGAAATQFQRYLDLTALTADHRLDGYAYFGLAQIAEAAGQSSTAIDEYRHSVLAGVPFSQETVAATKVGLDLSQRGSEEPVAAWYEQLASRPGLDGATRSHYQVLEANTLRHLGQSATAESIYRLVLTENGSPIDTVAAVAALRSLGSTLDELLVGQALLRAGQYDQAAQTLQSYISSANGSADLPTARLERGRALVFALQYDEAIAQLQEFQTDDPTDSRLGEAALLIGKAKLVVTGAAAAAAFLESFASGHPDDAASPQVLADAIGYLKGSSDPTTALPLEQELIDKFPKSPLAATAAFDRGWADYESLDFTAATDQWQAAQSQWPTSPNSPAALLWLGKIRQHAGDPAGARQAFDLAWQANPGDYYAFRARELANGTNGAPPVAAPLVNASAEQLAKERADLDAWLMSWTQSPPGDLDKLYDGAPLAQTPILARIAALQENGLDDQAELEFKQATRAYADDGRSLFALADSAATDHLTADSSAAADQLLLLSPAQNAYQAPRYLQRLVYPFPYQNAIEAAAAKYSVDPLLLVALIRQESSFDPSPHSTANAIGLTQFLPATARTIAASVGLKEFALTDLDQPRVAIELGAAYLATEIRQNGGNPYLALAAYNAGDGQVQKWLSDNPHHDVDLLVEEIPYAETRDYVRNVYRFYQEYQLLYRSAD